jgi:hypothetical protein
MTIYYLIISVGQESDVIWLGTFGSRSLMSFGVKVSTGLQSYVESQVGEA